MLQKFRCFIEENTLAYSAAVNSWLKERTSDYSGWTRKARFVSKDKASRIAERVHSSLGDKSAGKEWLGACLLKTISGNQRWHKRNELIDGFPEATSYFKEAP